MNSVSGFNVSQMFESSLNSVSNKGKELSAKMEELLQGDELSTDDMMIMQFEVGQYNAMMEALSTVTKSMTDMLKSLAQRSS